MSIDVRDAGAAKSSLRPDIQAMRGVAVLLVLLYHMDVPWVAAGYLGVDIFFVISGFLITGMIQSDLEAKRFSFSQFYYRRAKRLLPASLVVVLVTVLLAPFFLVGLVLAELKAQVLGAVTLSTNIVLLFQSGYFELEAATKPLLHFWSLAVEEQYYLVMPALLFVVPRRWWVHAIGAITLASAAFCFWLVTRDQPVAFYLLPTRAWELGLGSLVALLWPTLRGARVISLLRIPALAAIVLVTAFPFGAAEPGLNAAIACLATAIVIAGHNNHELERSPPVRALAAAGDFSYSLYLVHWPLLVFARAIWLVEPPPEFIWGAGLISLPLAWLLYRFVEEPFRRGFAIQRFRVVSGIALAAILTGAAPFALHLLANPVDYEHIRRTNYGMAPGCTVSSGSPWQGKIHPKCMTTSDPKYLLIGDSYGMAWSTALKGPLADDGFAQVTFSACDPLLGMARFPKRETDQYNRSYARGCMAFYQQMVDFVAGTPSLQTVILAGRMSTILSNGNLMLMGIEPDAEERKTSVDLAAEGMSNLVRALEAAGKSVVVIEPPPADGSEIGDCLERQARHMLGLGRPFGCEIARPDYLAYRKRTKQVLTAVTESTGVPVVSVNDGFLCDEQRCRTVIDGAFIYRDSGHLSVEGSTLIGARSDLGDQVRRSSAR